MIEGTTTSTRADRRRRVRRTRTIGGALLVIAVLATAEVTAVLTAEGRPAPIVIVERRTDPAGAPAPAAAAPTTIATPPTSTAAAPIVVPDPRPGDLRLDPRADTLPRSYSPPPAAATMLDVPYGEDAHNTLDIHLPDAERAPVVMYLHTGGWVGGEKGAVPDFVMRFVERGYAVASVDYRLAPEHPFPAAIHDSKRALRWLKAFGAETNLIDPERIVVVGGSAGGHLAAFVAATPGRFEPEHLSAETAAFDSTVAGVVAVVGPTDLVEFYDQPGELAERLTHAFVGCNPCSTDALEEASPRHHLHPDLPPAYWAYGADDGLVDARSQGIAMAEAWAAAGGPLMSWLDIVDRVGHNIDESQVNQRFLEAFVDVVTATRGRAVSTTAPA